jgi:hypothetical protein
VVSNVDLTQLSQLQRLAVGVQIWDQVRALKTANGEYRPRDPHQSRVKSGIGSMEDIDRAVAVAVNVPHTALSRVRPCLLQRPDLLRRLQAGEFETLNAFLREAGFLVKGTLAEGRPSMAKHKRAFFGHGDKFEGAIEPLNRYFHTWEKRDYKFTHVPPRLAKKRVAKIDRLIEQLERAKADLEQRSHVATLSAPREERRTRK